MVLPSSGRPVSLNSCFICSSEAPSKTGDLTGIPFASRLEISRTSSSLRLSISFLVFEESYISFNFDLSALGLNSRSIISSSCCPSSFPAHPRWVSKTWPTFILEGTPRGLRTISTGVPFGRYGMSSSASILDITPLLPCLPAILSPTCSFLFTAILTFTTFSTPGGSSSGLVSLEIL